jgi:hypothetical protein
MLASDAVVPAAERAAALARAASLVALGTEELAVAAAAALEAAVGVATFADRIMRTARDRMRAGFR